MLPHRATRLPRRTGRRGILGTELAGLAAPALALAHAAGITLE
jgi:hypothetical protein